MTDRIARKIRSLLPGVPIGRAPVARRGRAVIIHSRPLASARFRRNEHMTLRFLAPSFAEAKEMYLTVRAALVSDGNEGRFSEGKEILVIREMSDGSSAGYIQKSGMYHFTATFTVTGY